MLLKANIGFLCTQVSRARFWSHTCISMHIFYFPLRTRFRDLSNITEVGHPSEELGRFCTLYETEDQAQLTCILLIRHWE